MLESFALSASRLCSLLQLRLAPRFLMLGMVFSFAALPLPGFAQEEEPPAKPGVKIVFLPPPMEGTLSLGIYSTAGKLARVVCSEASAEKDFTVGLNGLITQWDGRLQGGVLAPAGKYAARGYSVGELEVQGIAFHGNDWVTDANSPRIRQISSLALGEGNKLLLKVALADGTAAALDVSETGAVAVRTAPPAAGDHLPPAASSPPEVPSSAPKRLTVRGGQLVAFDDAAETAKKAEIRDPIASCAGASGSLWVIDRLPDGVQVQQFSADGELLRSLAVAPGDPPPVMVAASTTSEFLALLEADPTRQRLRCLALETTQPGNGVAAVSTWRTLFSKTIQLSDDASSTLARLGLNKAFAADEKLHVRLLANPLFKDAVHELGLKISVDPKGANLTSADGLPLCRLTETPHLKWAVIGHEGGGKAFTVYESDGAVVEEFRVQKLANIMAFDAGEYEWNGKDPAPPTSAR